MRAWLKRFRTPATEGGGWVIFTGHWAFLVQMLYWMVAFFGFVAVPLIAITGFIIYKLTLPVLTAGLVYTLSAAAYLTFARKWHVFLGWFITRKEWLKDRFSRVRRSLRLLRQEYGDWKAHGIFVGMAFKTRFPKVPPLPLKIIDDRHVVMIAGSRAGKDRAFILPNAHFWKGSMFLNDPAGELFRESAAWRQQELGQDVRRLDPFNITGTGTDCWNPFDELDEDDPFLVDKVRLISESTIPDREKDSFWSDAGRDIFTGICLHVFTTAIPEQRNLGTVHNLLMAEDMDIVWTSMSRNKSLGGLVKRFGESCLRRPQKELYSAIQNARVATAWLDGPAMRNLTGRSTFKLSDLKATKMSLYLILPPGIGASYANWLRILTNMAFNTMQDVSIPKPDKDVLFMLDEFPLLGRMERIERAAGEIAKFGVKLFIVAQDITQLKHHYDEMWETFIANAGVTIMFGNNDTETQKYISARLGKEWREKTSRSTNDNGSSVSTSQDLQDVMRPDELESVVSRQSGNAFIFLSGEKPWCIPRANYDEWGFLETEKKYIPPNTSQDDPPDEILIAAE